ncbi:MAG: DUF3558 domain-containing protein [Dehalococcoidia bacterium]|nr:DUF3558 domain-containing protein [Dehalococcoidia bacterium]
MPAGFPPHSDARCPAKIGWFLGCAAARPWLACVEPEGSQDVGRFIFRARRVRRHLDSEVTDEAHPRQPRGGRGLPALLGCSGNGGANNSIQPSQDNGPSSSATSPAEGGSLDPCSLLSNADASDALGATVSQAERPSEAQFACRYTAPRGQGLAVLTVSVTRSPSPASARTGFQSTLDSLKSQFPESQFPGLIQTATGIGDQAYHLGDQLHVLRGAVYMVIGGDVSPEQARSLAQKALGRLN